MTLLANKDRVLTFADEHRTSSLIASPVVITVVVVIVPLADKDWSAFGAQSTDHQLSCGSVEVVHSG